MENNGGGLYVGIDFREALPQVCYQDGQMEEAQALALDFGGCATRTACFGKILSALKKYGKKEKFSVAVVLPDLSKETIQAYETDACEAGFTKEQLKMTDAAESMAHLIMHQTNDIWQQQVWLLEFDKEKVHASGFWVNKRAVPMLVEALKPQIWQIGEEDDKRDERFLLAVREGFGKKQVSGVFVTGTDLNEKIYKKSRVELCRGRRVFLAERIYARGACVLAGERGKKKQYLFLSEQTLLYNVGIRSFAKGEESVHTLIDAGCGWHEARGECEVLLTGEPLLEIVFWSMMGGEPVYEGMKLTDMPRREEGYSRLHIKACFISSSECEVQAADLGFGEMYPASELCWKETFRMHEEEDGM